MRKNKLVILLSAALIVIISVFGFTDVGADVGAEDFDHCHSYFWQGQNKMPGPYEIKVIKDNGTWPIPVVGGCDFDGDPSTPPDQCNNYKYQVTENGYGSTGINTVLGLTPFGVLTCEHSNCDGSNVNQIAALGAGFTDVGDYGYLIDHEYGIRVPPATDGFMNILLNSDSVGLTSLAFKVGKTSYGCGPIKGIAAPRVGFAQYAVQSYSEWNSESGGLWCVEEDPTTQCGKVVYCADYTDAGGTVHPKGEEASWVDVKSLPFGGGLITRIASPGQACPKFLVKDDNPGNTEYAIINGRAYPCPPYPFCR